MTAAIAGKPFGRIGFGGGPLGVHGFGKVDLVECHKAVRYALDKGITFFDTSDAYGKGVGEDQLAQALGGAPALIATKGGIRFGSENRIIYDSTPTWLGEALDQSLKRLKTDYIDLYQLHYWDQTTPLDDVIETFQSFKEAGKIGAFGVSNLVVDPHQVPLSADLMSYSFDYSMVARNQRPRINAMATAYPDAVFVPTGILAQGLLSGRYGKDSVFEENDRRANSKYVNFQPETFARLGGFLELLKNQPHSPVSLAIAWAICANPQSVPLVGIKSRAQVDAMLMACDLADTGDLDWTWVEKAYASGLAAL